MTTHTATLRRFHREPVSLRVLRWTIGPLLVIYAPLALFSGYRAIWQVRSVALVAEPVVKAGATIRYGVVSWGRVPVDVELEVVQGRRLDTLAVQWLREHTEPSLDPRWIRGNYVLHLASEQLQNLSAGPAALRLIANGKSQWLRVPPPKIVEMPVTIAK